jgi:hypothetical protein
MPVRNIPDFARTTFGHIDHRDARFLIEKFPGPGRSYQEIAELIDALPLTLESSLNSDWLFESIFDQKQKLLDISPFLLFSVLLRRCWEGSPGMEDRKVLNYLANLLSLFVHGDRMHRVQAQDREEHSYLTALIEEALQADSQRQFLIHSHIGNYSLFLTGIFPHWVDHRHRYRKRPVNLRTYIDFGSGYFQQASTHGLAREYGLQGVFLRLAMMFDEYRTLLNRMASTYLQPQWG